MSSHNYQMDDVHVEDVRRQTHEHVRKQREKLEQMSDEQKEDRRKQKSEDIDKESHNK
jgi:hypothetical protein